MPRARAPRRSPHCVRTLSSVLLLALASAPAGAQQGGAAADAPNTTAFVGARIASGSGEPPLENAVLLVEGGRITAVGAADTLQIPEGARRVELAGKTLVPGLINAHGHVTNTRGLSTAAENYTEAHVREQLGLYARYGVTAVFSLGGDGEAGVRVRGAQDAALERARLFLAGPVVDATSPEQAREQVRAVKALGADLVKIRVDDGLGTTAKMAPEVYRAVIEEAHAQGLKVAAHLYYLEDAKGLLRAGVDLLAHSVRDQAVDAELIGLLREKGVCLVPTLTREISAFAYAERPAFFSDPFLLQEADPAVLEELAKPERQQQVAANPNTAVYRQALVTAKANLKALSDAGIPIAFGTDSGTPARFQGYFEHLELEQMAEAGLRPAQILRAATADAARCLGQDAELGALRAGHWADFVALDADPLTDIRNLRRIHSVWIAGNRVPAKPAPAGAGD